MRQHWTREFAVANWVTAPTVCAREGDQLSFGPRGTATTAFVMADEVTDPTKETGKQIPKTREEAFGGKDWWVPLADLIYTVFLLLLDGLAIVALMGFAQVVKFLLILMGVPPVEIYGVEIHAAQILKNFDYVLFLLFLLIQGFKLLRSMTKA